MWRRSNKRRTLKTFKKIEGRILVLGRQRLKKISLDDQGRKQTRKVHYNGIFMAMGAVKVLCKYVCEAGGCYYLR